MKILAIDSSAGLSVALHDGEKVIVSVTRNDHGVQGELTADFIAQALEQAAWKPSDITDVVVGVGPGPYTGLRVGIVTALVFAHARKIALHAVCSLDAIGFASGKECIVVTDARRKEVYWAKYENGQRVSEPQVTKPADLVAQFPNAHFVGPGADLYPDVLTGQSAELHAADLAQACSQGLTEVLEASPLYLRKPDADEPAPREQVSL